MDHLTPDQLRTLRDLLEHEHTTLLQHQQPARTELSGGHRPDVGDQQDAAASEAASSLHTSLGAHERGRVQAIEAALARIAAGTYGVCEVSDEPIPYARLVAEPTARMTVEAQADRELADRNRDADAADDERRAY